MAQQGQGGIDPAVLDDIINRLLEFRQARPAKQVQLMESEIRQLCTVSREIFLRQPNLLELEAPIKICGTFFWVNMVLNLKALGFFIFIFIIVLFYCGFLVVCVWLLYLFMKKKKRIFEMWGCMK